MERSLLREEMTTGGTERARGAISRCGGGPPCPPFRDALATPIAGERAPLYDFSPVPSAGRSHHPESPMSGPKLGA